MKPPFFPKAFAGCVFYCPRRMAGEAERVGTFIFLAFRIYVQVPLILAS